MLVQIYDCLPYARYLQCLVSDFFSSSFRMLSRILRLGVLRSGIGASQSVGTPNTFYSTKERCRPRHITVGSIVILFVAGFCGCVFHVCQKLINDSIIIDNICVILPFPPPLVDHSLLFVSMMSKLDTWTCPILSLFISELEPLWDISGTATPSSYWLSLMLRPTAVGQSVLEQSTHLGLTTKFLLLSDSCRFVDMGCCLWREDGSVVYSCCWSLPAHSFSGPRPVGHRKQTCYCYRGVFASPLHSNSRSTDHHGKCRSSIVMCMYVAGIT
jgi:hypothetical protein